MYDFFISQLDAESVAWLERYLSDFKGTVVAVTHDRYFLENSCGWILELDRGQGIPHEGNYSGWLEQKARRLVVEKRQDDRLRRALESELEWVRATPRARQAKSKARLTQYEELLAAAPPSYSSGSSSSSSPSSSRIYIPPGPRLGDVVVEAAALSKAYGGRALMQNLSFSIPPGAIVGVIGNRHTYCD